jgi:alanyl-tRNA synthetase
LSAEHRRILEDASRLLKVEPEGLLLALDRLNERQRQAEKEIASLRSKSLEADAAELGATQVNGVVVATRDGLVADQMRELVQAVRRRPNVKAVVIGGSPDGEKVVLAAATDGSSDAGALVKQAAAIVGGRGGGTPQLAVAGGRDTTRIDEALRVASVALGVADSDGAGGGPR